MNRTEIIKAIAQREGGKRPTHIGNIREIVGIIADLMVEHPSSTATLIKYGESRRKRRKNSKVRRT
jgi:hypothetical protein